MGTIRLLSYKVTIKPIRLYKKVERIKKTKSGGDISESAPGRGQLTMEPIVFFCGGRVQTRVHVRVDSLHETFVDVVPQI